MVGASPLRENSVRSLVICGQNNGNASNHAAMNCGREPKFSAMHSEPAAMSQGLTVPSGRFDTCQNHRPTSVTAIEQLIGIP